MLISAKTQVGRMKAVGLVHVYNERDIIEDFLDHMAKQQIPLIIVDNGSTDGTYGIIQKDKSNIVLRHAQLNAPKFELVVLLRLLHAMAVQEKPDWLLLTDADGFMEAQNGTLCEAIDKQDHEGHNLIQFDVFKFWPTPQIRPLGTFASDSGIILGTIGSTSERGSTVRASGYIPQGTHRSLPRK